MRQLSDLNWDRSYLYLNKNNNIPGNYSIELKKVAQEKIQELYPNYLIDFENQASFDLWNTELITINYPKGWILSDQEVPTKIQINGGITQIHIKHAKTVVKADDPKTTDDVLPHNTDAHYPDGVKKEDLNKTITRKIIINLPNGEVKTRVQIANFTRDAEVDEATGDIHYLKWRLDKNGLTEYLVPKYQGYKANLEKVNYEIPNVNSHYDDLVIEYVADKLSDDSPTDSHDDVINTNSSLDNFLSEKDREDNNSQYERLNQNDDIFNAPLGKAEVPDKRSDKKTQSYKNHHKVISNANITQFNKYESSKKLITNDRIPNSTEKDKKVNKVENIKLRQKISFKNSTKILPETGENNQYLPWMGILLSMLGLNGLVVRRKKKMK